MSKHDELLNELVYQIDDIVYDFYSKSNEIIAGKLSQERLLEFRDNSLNTINDMNVRSLEIISDFKKRELVEQRAINLLVKNEEIVASVLNVLETAPNKSDLVKDVTQIATNLYDSAKKVVQNIEESEAFDKIVDATQTGFHKVVQGVDDLSKDERVIKGKEVIIDKTKEAVDLSAHFVKESTKKVSDWIDEKAHKNDTDNEEHE